MCNVENQDLKVKIKMLLRKNEIGSLEMKIESLITLTEETAISHRRGPPQLPLLLCICTGRPSPLCNMMRLPQTWWSLNLNRWCLDGLLRRPQLTLLS